MNHTTEQPGGPLESLPGMVRGIVAVNPYKVQCDGCWAVQGGNSRMGGAQIILADITFNPRRYDTDKRRLCRECRKKEWGTE